MRQPAITVDYVSKNVLRSALLACVTIALAVGPAQAQQPPLRWLRDLDEARRVAAVEHKDLLVNFTGLEWCGHCIDLEEVVLSRQAFRPAEADFVLVDLDFPSDRTELGPLHDRYEAWVKQYLIHGFPTVMLMDGAGKPYAYFTGCDENVEVDEYLAQLTAAKKARAARDQAFASAEKASGAERARHLHAGVQAIAEALGTLDDREDDPVLALYGETVDEICRLDADNALALRGVYDARKQARDTLRRRTIVLAELERYKTKEDCPAAIEHIDRLLAQATDDGLKFSLKQRRASMLEWLERHVEALAAWRQLTEDPACPAYDRQWMTRNQAIVLYRLGRLDEALAFYDSQVAAAKDDAARAYFLMWKANLLYGSKRHEETLATCRARQAAEKPKSHGWWEATSMLGFALQQAGQHEQAIAIRREALAYTREKGQASTGTLLQIAASQRALGLKDDAQRTLDEVERELALPGNRPARQKQIDGVRDQLKKEREALAARASDAKADQKAEAPK